MSHDELTPYRGSLGAAYPLGIDIDMTIERTIREITNVEIDISYFLDIIGIIHKPP